MVKIVLSGAPSSGKSSVAKLLSPSKNSQIVIIPESAALLLTGGYPAPSINDLELDRATLDGARYWPLGIEDFFRTFNINVQSEITRYQ